MQTKLEEPTFQVQKNSNFVHARCKISGAAWRPKRNPFKLRLTKSDLLQVSDLSVDIDPNPLFYQDNEGTLRGCNQSFERLIGKERYETVGLTVDELFDKETAAIITRNFQQVLQAHKANQFIATLPNGSPVARSFLATMCFSNIASNQGVVVSSLADISLITNNLTSGNIDLKGQLIAVPSNSMQNNASPPLELSMYSEKIKSEVADRLNRLQSYVNEDGKRILLTILRNFRSEFSDGIDFISERLFDEKHKVIYEVIAGKSARVTKTEMRLCALLSLNYNQAEIATLTRKSTNSINVAFARIRAKLGFRGNDELKDFLKTLRRDARSPSEHSGRRKRDD